MPQASDTRHLHGPSASHIAMATLERSISHVLVVPKSIPTIDRLRDAIVLRWTREKITGARDPKQGRLLAVLMP